ncbi:MAG: hypothetical protein ACE15C_03115 [Phycisphaerae bacterium]
MADSAAGKKTKCRLCGTVATAPFLSVPDGPELRPEGEIDLAGLDQGVPVDEGPRPTLAPAPVRVLPGLNPETVLFGRFVRGCFKSVVYAFGNFPALLGMVILLMIVGGVLFLAYTLIVYATHGRFALTMDEFTSLPGGYGLTFLLAAAIDMAASGFILSFFIDLGYWSATGNDDTPSLMGRTGLARLVLTGLKGFALQMVYVAPIITIPLLPLGILGLCYTGDHRAFDLGWALKAAARRPAQLFVLWMVVLLYIVVSVIPIVLTVVIGLTILHSVGASGLGGGLLLMIVGALMIAVIVAIIMVIGAIMFRCAGLLGWHYGELLKMIPERRQVAVPIVCLVIGLIVTIAGEIIWSGVAARRGGQIDGRFNYVARARVLNAMSARIAYGWEFSPSTPSKPGDSEWVSLPGVRNPFGRAAPTPPVYVGPVRVTPPPAVNVTPPPVLPTPTGPPAKTVIVSKDPYTITYEDRLTRINRPGRFALTINQRLEPADVDRFIEADKSFDIIAKAIAEFAKANPGRVPASFDDLVKGQPSGSLQFAGQPSDYAFVRGIITSDPGDDVLVYGVNKAAGNVQFAAFKDGHTLPLEDRDLSGRLQTQAQRRIGSDGATANLKELYAYLKAFAQANGGRFPASMDELKKSGLVKDESHLRSRVEPGQLYVLVAGGRTDSEPKDILVHDPTVYPNSPDYRYVLHVDGQVGTTSARYLQEEIQRQTIAWGLKNLYVCLQTYAKGNGGRFPATLDELQRGGLAKDDSALRSPLGERLPYGYLAGQNVKSRAKNVLAFDPTPRGQEVGSSRHVLHADGTVSEMSISEAPADFIARKRAEQNLLTVFEDLKTYATSHDGKYPASLDELKKAGQVTDESCLHSPDAPSSAIVYVAGYTQKSMPSSCIILYDPKPAGGKIVTVRIDGSADTETSLESARTNADYWLAHKREGGAGPSPTGGAVETPTLLAVIDKTLTVDWSVTTWQSAKDLPQDHPFRSVCQVIKEMKLENKYTAVVGVSFGQPAKDKNDKAYAEFRKALSDFWADKSGVKDRKDMKQTVGKVEYDRINSTQGNTVATVFMGVHDGRCVSYWFLGNSNCFPTFTENLDKATAKGQ